MSGLAGGARLRGRARRPAARQLRLGLRRGGEGAQGGAAGLRTDGRPAARPEPDLRRRRRRGRGGCRGQGSVQANPTFLTLAYGFARTPDATTGPAPADLVGEGEADRAVVGAEAVMALARTLATELDEEP